MIKKVSQQPRLIVQSFEKFTPQPNPPTNFSSASTFDWTFRSLLINEDDFEVVYYFSKKKNLDKFESQKTRQRRRGS